MGRTRWSASEMCCAAVACLIDMAVVHEGSLRASPSPFSGPRSKQQIVRGGRRGGRELLECSDRGSGGRVSPLASGVVCVCNDVKQRGSRPTGDRSELLLGSGACPGARVTPV